MKLNDHPRELPKLIYGLRRLCEMSIPTNITGRVFFSGIIDYTEKILQRVTQI